MAQQTDSTPHIEIRLERGTAAIHQTRPAVLPQLAGMDVDQALRLVATLLPVCGAAQSIAAARAVEAARGTPAEPEIEVRREQQLVREQALSCGWRLAVDWPDLLGESREMNWLKQMRASVSPEQISRLLRAALPGLESATSELSDWAGRRHCTAARVLHATIVADIQGDACPLAGELLDDTARTAMARTGFESHSPTANAVEVGALAMQRHPQTGQLPFECAANRTAALLLDTLQVCTLLSSGVEGHNASWDEGAGRGSGRAVTARGPVYHRVELAGDNRVGRWLSLVPTDWHFATAGPLAAALAAAKNCQQARLLVAGFDPCVPCNVTGGRV